MSEPWIQFKNWSFTYDNGYGPALDEINLTLYRGEKVLVLGANTSGKSTFVRALKNELGTGQFSGYSEGEIIRDHHNLQTIDGEPIIDAVDRQETTQQIAGIDWTHLDSQEEIMANYAKLSTGQRDIVRLMGGMDYDQSVFIFDEPLANLAPKTQQAFIDLLDDFSYANNATIVLSGFRLEQTMYRPIDRVIVLNEGRVVFDGSVPNLLKSEVLPTFHIREPLYVSAIRYSGYPLHQVRNIENVNHIYGQGLKTTIEKWLLSIPHFVLPKSNEQLLTFDEATYQYPNSEEYTVDHLSVTFHKGEIVSVVGGNGAGKTTLSRILNGELTLTSGHYYFHNDSDEANHHHRVTFIPHDPWERLTEKTIREQLTHAILEAGMAVSDHEERMHQSLQALGLHYAIDLPIESLSYGQQKRILLAQALLFQSEVLIIDEPTEGQDYYHYNELMQYIYTISQRENILVLINSHDIDMALEFTQRTLVLKKGHLVADTTPINVATNPQLIHDAELRPTNLYTFAKQIHLVDPYGFIDKFTNYNRAINQ